MDQPLRTLIIEDSEDDALLLVRHLLRGNYQPRWQRVETPQALATALEREPWDIIFADYSMPQFSGTQALALVRGYGIDSPFIFVSGTIGEETAVDAMRLGAHDYVMKDNLARLLPAVERELREAARRHEQRRAEEELRLLQSLATASATAGDVPAALAAALSHVCETLGWSLAQVWLPRPDGATIECSPAWHCRTSGLEKFRTASLQIALAGGMDLPGQVWASRQPLWVADVTRHDNFTRASAAFEAGLKTALEIPVLADNKVLAVIEFFANESRAEDPRQIKLLGAVAEQLGGVIQRKRAEERLHYLAHFDALTGLPNRVLFLDRLRQAIFEADRHKRLVGVALLDLDRFKTINDSMGHGIGDLLLRSIAERLGRCVREGDTVARLAGDEFTLILADMGHAEDAAHVARKILSRLAEPFHIAGHELYAGASLGMTLYPSDGSDTDALLRNADVAMYRAKAAGGNTYAFYSVDMTIKARERLALEGDLRHAVDQGQFVLHYQPVVDLRTGQVDGFEALVRWQHPQRGLIAPAEFIPIAEESGLIVRLGEWVLRAACEEFEAYRQRRPGLRLAVNVSARQFQQPDLPETVAAVLREARSDPALLDLEITESVLMQDTDNALAVMHRLNANGVRFSVDDFGTGYSSFTYLKALPISQVKIDQSFVRDMSQSNNDVAIVAAIISMAQNLGLQVTAEGVETREQLDLLRARGCDAAQGYFFSRPIPAAEALLRLQQGMPPWA